VGFADHFNRFDPVANVPKRPIESEEDDAFLAKLEQEIAARFEALSGYNVQIVSVLPESSQDGNHTPEPCPAATDECDYRSIWRRHVDELRRAPLAHWHKCAFDRWCGVVPVAVQDQCLAACKVVLPGETPQNDFERVLGLLGVLVENFTLREQPLLQSVARRLGATEGDDADRQLPDRNEVLARAAHYQVREALAYIDAHLADADLSVELISRTLDVNASYLAHLFAVQTGIRMSQYIATQRMDQARHLLLTTDHPIKQVAFDVGYANPDWFSQAFRKRFGVTPSSFRANHAPR
jgi:AraC-like DNA-binding protein